MRATEHLTIGCDPKSLTARQLMQHPGVTATPRACALALAWIMTDRNFGSLPIIGTDRTLLGIVSEADLLKVMATDRDLRDVTAADLMTKEVTTASEDVPFLELAKLLQDHALIRVPVVRGETLVGIVARRDLVFGYFNAMLHILAPREP